MVPSGSKDNRNLLVVGAAVNPGVRLQSHHTRFEEPVATAWLYQGHFYEESMGLGRRVRRGDEHLQQHVLTPISRRVTVNEFKTSPT